jgi:serine protease Do
VSEEQKEFSYINEKIKEKPVSKKKILKKILLVIVLAVIFGVVACFTFVIVKPVFLEKFGKEDEASVELTEAETSTDSGQLSDADSVEEEVAPVQPEIIVESSEMEIDDYQNLQNKLYEIGKSADNYIVTVTGVSSDVDWFNTPYEKEGQGSGFIISNTGRELLIATPQKVISGAETISVTFCNHEVAQGTIKGYDKNTGLAIVSIADDELTEETKETIQVAQLGNSTGISRGDIVIAVGSPNGTNYSVLTGNITSINNEITTIDRNFSVFTTNIVGSSGGSGAILNSDGKIIGLIMQEYAASGSENIMTAVSISQLKNILESLSNGKSIPYLGLKLSTVTNQLAEEHGIVQGAYIISVEMDSPAMQAGLQSGDVITSFNGEEITSVYHYETVLEQLSPQDTVRLSIQRMGAENSYTEMTFELNVGVLE